LSNFKIGDYAYDGMIRYHIVGIGNGTLFVKRIGKDTLEEIDESRFTSGPRDSIDRIIEDFKTTPASYVHKYSLVLRGTGPSQTKYRNTMAEHIRQRLNSVVSNTPIDDEDLIG